MTATTDSVIPGFTGVVIAPTDDGYDSARQVDATAFPYRGARWLFNVPASWADPADSDYEIAWVRDTFAAIQPFSTGGAYSNFMEGDETSNDQVAYGSTLRRLQAIKAVYDPDNVFRLNQNITPVPA